MGETRTEQLYKKTIITIGCIVASGLWFGCGGATETTLDTAKAGVISSPLLEVKSAPSELEAGDVMWVSFDAGGAAVDFSGIVSGARFKLVLQSAATGQSIESVTLGDLNAAIGDDEALEEAIDPADAFHDHLRAEEQQLSYAMQELPPVTKA